MTQTCVKVVELFTHYIPNTNTINNALADPCIKRVIQIVHEGGYAFTYYELD